MHAEIVAPQAHLRPRVGRYLGSQNLVSADKRKRKCHNLARSFSSKSRRDTYVLRIKPVQNVSGAVEKVGHMVRRPPDELRNYDNILTFC